MLEIFVLLKYSLGEWRYYIERKKRGEVMSKKDTIICDIETGICGPVGEENPIGLIDLTALTTNKDSDSTTEVPEIDYK